MQTFHPSSLNICSPGVFFMIKNILMLVQILIFYDQEYQNIFLETFLLQNSFLFFFFFEKCHFTLTFSIMTTVHFCK